MTAKHLITLCFGAAASMGAVHAATINYASSVENTTVNEWLTASTAKSMDIDGDNVYGTFGAVHWTILGANQQTSGSSVPGWAYLGETSFGQFRNPDYAVIDNLASPSSDTQGAIAAVQSPGVFTFEMTGTPATYAGRTLRVGVMADILGPTEWAADTGKAYQLVQTVGGSGDSGLITLRGGAAANGQPEMYFFDVTVVNPGDTFQIIALGTPGGSFPGYIGPMSWDLSDPVPEPSSALLAGVALLGLTRRRRA